MFPFLSDLFALILSYFGAVPPYTGFLGFLDSSLKTVPTFSLMLTLASLVGTFYIYRLAPKKGLSQVAVLDLGIIGTIAGIVGSRLFHVFVEAPAYYWEKPMRVFYVWQGGFVSYGAIILVTLSFITYLKLRKLDLYKYLDLTALSFPLMVILVRIGCLGAGCCYGKPTDFFFHLIFRNPSSDAGHKFLGTMLHATQIYDILNGIFLFCLLSLIDRRKKFDGQVVWSALIGYGFIRGLIEFLRGDADRGVYLGGLISTAQVTGLLAVSIGTIMYLYCRKRAQRNLSTQPS